MAGTGIDTGMLHKGAHSASYFDLSRSMGEDVEIVDFCIPCNPYFPTPEMFDELSRDLQKILKYYPSDSATITAKLASVLQLHPQTVAMANGSTELITWIDHLLIKESVAIPIPTFGRWTDQPLETGKRVDMFPLQERDGFRLDLEEYVRFIRDRGSRVAVVCNVNNPDGNYLPRRDVIRFMDALVDLDLVVIDESFIDFSDTEPYPSVGPDAVIRPNAVVLKSLGKNFGLHGIRFGYLMANPAIAARIGKALPKWNLNSLAEKVVFMISAHDTEYEESLRLLSRDRRMMAHELRRIPGLTVFPSQGNFILVKLPNEWSGVALRDYLVANHAVYTRECGNKLGMTSQFMRLVVRPSNDVDRLITGMLDYGRQWQGDSDLPPSFQDDPRSFRDDPLDGNWTGLTEQYNPHRVAVR
ncbi:pyridoxal phosphate-dependent aminotransferase [Jidongwangia harbinensis]|uniref:pyridoxal phosphate-dependent aminotransferase n=1 Tax=Jidongwangia harbinensis TaxID=2878561 RepID=UPI001CD9C097|nr:histidinol-phosphate transaminase [Jidongwangia harbinensis]MCA2214507.1 histidinol-phosphate aminotransferase family protein [Jidongwangia harbinensis]